MTMDIATLGLAVDARQVKDGDRALDNFERTARRTEQSNDRLNKSFDRMASMLKAAAAAFGAYKLYEHIKEATLLAARYETMGVVMGVAGNNAGYTRREMAELERQLTKTGISILKSREVLTSLATANIDLSKASAMARASQDLAVVANINSSDAFARMVHGIKSGETEVLRTMGLNVSFENSYKKLAAQLHVNKDALTEQQKVMARTNAVMEESAKYSGIYEESMTTAGKQIKSLERYIEDLKVKAGETFLPVLADGVARVTEALKAANIELDKAGSEGIISKIGTGLGGAFKYVYQTVAVLAANVGFVLNVVGTRIGALFAQVSTIWEAWKGSGVLSPTEFAERMKNAFSAAGAIGDQATKDNEAARKALDAYEAKIMETAETDTKATARMVDNALDKEQARIAAGKAARAEQEAEAKRLKAAEEAAKQQKKYDEAYKALTRSISERVAAIAMEANQQEQLTDGQKFAIKILDDLRTGTLKLSQAKAIALRKDLESYLALEDETETLKRNREYRNDMLAGYQKGIDAIRAQVDTVKKQVETYGMAESAVLDLAVAEKRRYIESSTWSDEKLDALNAELDALKDLANWTRAKENKDAAKKAAEDARAAWEKTAEKINDSLTDALMRGFESGKGFAENMRDTIVNMFKTLILRPIISAIMNPVAVGMTNAVASTGMNVGGSMAGSMVSSAAANPTVWSTMGGATSGFNVGLGTASTADAAMFASAQTAGNLSAGASAGASAGSSLAAAGPYLAAAAAAYLIWKSLDHSGTPHTGGGATSDGAVAKYMDPRSLGMMTVQTNDTVQKMTENIALGVTAILNSTASTFNKKTGYTAATAFADDSSEDGAWGSLQIHQNGNKVIDWEDSRWSRWAPHEYDDGESGMKQYMAGIAEAVRNTLDDIGLPDWANKMLADLGDAPTVEQLGATVDQINAAQTALNNLGVVVKGFANISDAAMTALITASGGVANLINKLNGFYNGYYSEDEKIETLKKQLRTVFDTLNLTMPTTRKEFRDMVETQLALGEAAAPTVSKLLDVADAFGVVADYADKAATSTTAVAVATGPDPLQNALAQTDVLLGLVDNAYAGLERSVDAERKRITAAHDAAMKAINAQIQTVTDSVGNLKRISDSLHGAINRMTQQGAQGIDRAAAQAQLASTLAIARAGGKIDGDKLDTMLSAVTQDASGMYADETEYRRDYYKTAIALLDLSEYADDSLSIEEQTLKALEAQKETIELAYQEEMTRLDNILLSAQEQINELRGINASVQSLQTALGSFASAVNAAKSNPMTGATAAITNAYQSNLYRNPEDAGLKYWQGQVASGALTADGAVWNIANSNEAKVQRLYGSILNRVGETEGVNYWTNLLNNGTSMAVVENEFRNSAEYVSKHPNGFASGGQHAGGWRLVGERGPEFEYTAPSQIYSNADTKELLDQTPVREEIAALREDFNLFMYQVTKNTGDTAQQLRRWDQNGMPATTTS